MQIIEGGLDAGSLRVAIVAARFNHVVTRRLFDGAVHRLGELGCRETTEMWVPGAFELPLAAQAAAESGRYDAVIAIGVVIRGDTSHYDYVCRAVTDGLSEVSLSAGLPVAFCVVTTENVEQALERACLRGEDGENKGAEAAEVVVEMASLLTSIAEGG